MPQRVHCIRLLMTVLLLVLAGATIAAANAEAQDDPPGPVSLGQGTELLYDTCYEQVTGFRVPVSFIERLVGSELPAGFAYRTFDTAGAVGQLNVIGLDCDQGGHRVTDVLVNAVMNVPADFTRGLPTALRVRTYTNSPETWARHALYCFGGVRLGQVEASVDVDAVTGERRGHAFASDGASSIELSMTVRPPSRGIAAATLQHFTVEDGQVHGRIEWGVLNQGLSQALVPGAATLEVDGAPPPNMTVAAGQHVFPAEGAPHTFFHRGLTVCPPGLA